jgi:protease-4
MMFVKNSLDKLGVQVEVQHVGRYKDAGDMFTQNEMSPETREVMDSVLDNLYSDLLQTVAMGRKRSPQEIRAILDDGPFTAKQAKAKGLVDELRYEDQIYGELKDRLKQPEIKKLSHRDFFKAVEGSDRDVRKRIALLVGEGAIMRGSGEDAMFTDEGFTSGAFIQMVRKVANDRDINGVILRIDSPGGDAFASDEILREVKLLSQKKPTVVSMSDTAASGGYYVALSGDPIVAYPNTLTGSIGVLFGRVNLRGLYDKLGVRKEILKRGKNADIDSDYQALTPAARAKLQEGLAEVYQSFVAHVAEARKRRYEEMEPLAQGRVWLGSQAKSKGLVDELGGLDKAIELVKAKAKIAASERVRVVPYPPRRNIIEQYLKSTSESAVESKLRAFFGGFDYRLWSTGGVMKIMPYVIQAN